MKKLVVVASLLLSILMFAMGYMVVFVTSLIAITLKVPGPYATSPIGWVWFGLHCVMVFGASFLFCRWLAKRVERKHIPDRTFE